MDETPSMEPEFPENDPIPVEIEMAEVEDEPDEVTTSIEYDSHIEANLAEIYLDILKEKSEEISSPSGDGVSDSEIAILDVFGDESPELLYIYRYDDPDYFNDSVIGAVPCFFLEILSYSEPGGIESVFDSIVFVAAGGGGSYCVYLTHEGELMLYCSNASGGAVSWGFWKVMPNQSLESTNELGYYNSNLAKLHYVGFYDGEASCYKKNGEEISKEQYDLAAKEIMEDIDRVIFQDSYGLYKNGHDDLWKDITPFEAECLTHAEAVAWLEAQLRTQRDD